MSKNRAEIGEENYQKFLTWIKARKLHKDHLEYINDKGKDAGKLKKSAIANELGFGRAVFSNNPRIKELADRLSDKWGAEKGVIPETPREVHEARDLANNKVKRTEKSNSLLQEKVAMLEAELRQVKQQLANVSDYKTARDAFIETTRDGSFFKTNRS